MKKTRTKIVAVLLFAILLCTTVGGVMASASFGSGVVAVAADVKIVKTGIAGQKIIFSDSDFKQGLCILDFEKVKITALPDSTSGTLMLAGRRVGVGTEIKRKNLGALVFIPASKDISECGFKFSIEEFADGAEIDFTLRFTEKVNYAPEAADTEAVASISTQRDIPLYGKMNATDSEGDAMEFIVVSYPKGGKIDVINKNNGEYLYTPPIGFVGTESFSYVARDSYGNYSELLKVEITVNERMSEAVYVDMTDRKEYGDAVILTAMGVMDGKLSGDGVYFMPDGKVTRTEFVAMAMKCASIDPDKSLTATYFDDNSDIPAGYVSYIATAQRLGIINGKFTNGGLYFSPNEYITKYEAGVIMANILGANHTGDVPVFNDVSTIPVWAKNNVYALCSLGIFEAGDTFNGASQITRADAAVYLCKMMDCR